jgi:hypothetical protein
MANLLGKDARMLPEKSEGRLTIWLHGSARHPATLKESPYNLIVLVERLVGRPVEVAVLVLV